MGKMVEALRRLQEGRRGAESPESGADVSAVPEADDRVDTEQSAAGIPADELDIAAAPSADIVEQPLAQTPEADPVDMGGAEPVAAERTSYDRQWWEGPEAVGGEPEAIAASPTQDAPEELDDYQPVDQGPAFTEPHVLEAEMPEIGEAGDEETAHDEPVDEPLEAVEDDGPEVMVAEPVDLEPEEPVAVDAWDLKPETPDEVAEKSDEESWDDEEIVDESYFNEDDSGWDAPAADVTSDEPESTIDEPVAEEPPGLAPVELATELQQVAEQAADLVPASPVAEAEVEPEDEPMVAEGLDGAFVDPSAMEREIMELTGQEVEEEEAVEAEEQPCTQASWDSPEPVEEDAAQEEVAPTAWDAPEQSEEDVAEEEEVAATSWDAPEPVDEAAEAEDGETVEAEETPVAESPWDSPESVQEDVAEAEEQPVEGMSWEPTEPVDEQPEEEDAADGSEQPVDSVFRDQVNRAFWESESALDEAPADEVETPEELAEVATPEDFEAPLAEEPLDEAPLDEEPARDEPVVQDEPEPAFQEHGSYSTPEGAYVAERFEAQPLSEPDPEPAAEQDEVDPYPAFREAAAEVPAEDTPFEIPEEGAGQPGSSLGLGTLASHLVAYYQRNGELAEQYRSMRTNILAQMPGGEPHVLAFASSGPGEGVTTTVLNLAITIADGGERRVLVVDADLRDGNGAMFMGASPEPGLTDLLSDEASLDSVIQPTVVENLDIIGCGRPVADSTQLLSSSYARQLFEGLKDRYDLILIDAGPTSRTDAAVTAGLADGTYVAAVMGETNRQKVDRAIRQVEAAGGRVAGCVLTKVRYYIPAPLYRRT